MDLNTAYKIIGVTESSSLEEVNERYLTLTETKATIAQLDDIQTAYNIIKQHITEMRPKEKETFRSRVSHFFYHYKAHLIFGIIGAFIIGSLLYSIIGSQMEKRAEAKRPPAEVEMMLFGNYHQDDLSPLTDRIQALFPDWDRIEVDLEYTPAGSDDPNSEMGMAAVQKSQVTLATARPDVFIFDLHHYNAFQDSDLYLKLDQFKDNPKVKDRLMLHQGEDDDQEHVYGIDLTDHELFADMPIAEEDKIFIIRTDAAQPENALKLLE